MVDAKITVDCIDDGRRSADDFSVTVLLDLLCFDECHGQCHASGGSLAKSTK